MFEAVKKLFRRKPTPERDRARIERFDLTERPMTKALLIRSTSLLEDANVGLASMGVKPAALAERPTDLDGMIREGAAVIIQHVTRGALSHLKRDAEFLPLNPLPKDAPALLAFAIYLAVFLHGIVKDEGYSGPQTSFLDGLAATLFLMHPEDKISAVTVQAMAMFQKTARSELQNVQDWQLNLSKLVHVYVAQSLVVDPAVKVTDPIPVFAGFLQPFMASVE